MIASQQRIAELQDSLAEGRANGENGDGVEMALEDEEGKLVRLKAEAERLENEVSTALLLSLGSWVWVEANKIVVV